MVDDHDDDDDDDDNDDGGGGVMMMTNKTITFKFIQQIISSTLDRVLWKLLNSIDQRKGDKVMIQKYFIAQILVNIQIFTLVWETCLQLIPPTRANICIYTRKLYNKATFFLNSNFSTIYLKDNSAKTNEYEHLLQSYLLFKDHIKHAIGTVSL